MRLRNFLCGLLMTAIVVSTLLGVALLNIWTERSL